MCSINGCTYRDTMLVERMNAATHHRGPDDTGVWADEHVTLGNDRLAIIDVSPAGHQPMESVDGRFVIAFNGEIYNYRELRAKLQGYPFKSNSDTEVILAGFSKWGEDVFRRLDGIFAIALWDKEKRELFLARDRMGIKPLFIYKKNDRIVFSSEIKAILESGVPCSLNTVAFERYLRVGYTPEMTLLDGIEKFPPAHYMRRREGKTETVRFWEPSYENVITGKAAREELAGTIDRAVARQLVSERPVGIYLSGGIDSSVVLDAASRVHRAIDTYSVGFELADMSENEKFNSDFLVARKTAGHYGTKHHEYMLGTAGLPALFEDAIRYLDEPVANATSIAQLALSRFAKESVTVVLGGDGGDELFGGYPRYQLDRQMDLYQKIVPSPLRSALAGVGKLGKLNTPQGAGRYGLFHFIKDDVLKGIAPEHVSGELARAAEEKLRSYGNLSATERFMQLDREWWLVDESLLRTDRMTMAASVEARVPLLDNEVVALADRIPLGDKVNLYGTKIILKDAFRGRLPEYLFDQPKRGWFSPSAKWLRVPEFEKYARGVLSPGYAAATKDLFDWHGVERMLDAHVRGEKYNLHALWTVLAFQAWACNVL